MLRRVTLVITDVSEELSPSFIRVTRIGELGTTLAVRRLLVTASVCSYFTDSYHSEEGGAKFFRNVGSYKSHTT
jgi:hypothetical protein